MDGSPLSARKSMTVCYRVNNPVYGFPVEAETSCVTINDFAEELKIHSRTRMVFIDDKKVKPTDSIPDDSFLPLDFITNEEHTLRVCVVKLRQTIVEKCNSNKYLFDVLDTYDYLYVIDAHSDRMLGVMDLGLPVVFYRLIYVYDKIDIKYCVDDRVGCYSLENKQTSFKNVVKNALEWSELNDIVVEVNGKTYKDLDQVILAVVPLSSITNCTFIIRNTRVTSDVPCCISDLGKLVYPPSAFASNNSVTVAGKEMCMHESKRYELEFRGHHIYDHRPNAFDCVTLYYGRFSTITEESKNIAIDMYDCIFALELCSQMMEHYDNEICRRNAFKKWAASFFRYTTIKVNSEVQLLQGKKSQCDIEFSQSAIVEVKNERGQTSSECLKECIAYYAQFIEARKNYNCSPFPLLLLCLDGPVLYVYGAVFMQNIIVDPLMAPLELLPVMRQRDHMIRIVRGLKALANGCMQLNNFYSTRSETVSSAGSRVWPEFREYKEGNKRYTLVYKSCVREHVYKCLLSTCSSIETAMVIVKFTSTWCEEANIILAANGFAPKLHYVGTQGFHKVVVMEFLDGVILDKYMKDNPSSKDTLRKECESALQLLHSNGYVHGDFRYQNILVVNDKIKIIDFNWAGSTDTDTRYPYFMNHFDIVWPEGATDGEPLAKEHDLYWLKQMFS